MPAITCKYHPQIPARWACEHCQINFCVSCAPAAKPGKLPRCPVCDRDLTSLGSGNIVKPFWQRLGQIFFYPMHVAPLLLIVTIVAINYFFGGIPNPLFQLALQAILFLVFFKFACLVLEDTAHGHFAPRSFSGGDAFAGDLILPLKLYALMAALGGVLFSIYDLFGGATALLAYFLVTLALPACTMVLVMEHSFFKAFNPLLIINVISRIGMPYMLMVILIYVLSGAAGMVGLLLHGRIPDVALWATVYFIYLYFGVITFHLMGYVLYQYHEDLGYGVEVEAEAHVAPAHDVPVDPDVRAAEILIAEGKNQEAAGRLAQAIQATPGNTEARDRLLKLARMIGDNALHTRQGQDYISYLFHDNKVGLATKVYLDCVQFDKQFRPARPNERVDIAKMLKANAQGKAAVTLLGNLHTEFPTYDGIPAAYLMAAKLLCEQFSDDAKAKQILQFLLRHYPAHATSNEVREYLAVVEKLVAK